MENEKALSNELQALEKRVSVMVINSDESYSFAGQMVKDIKSLSAKVKEYWEPLRVSTKKAYDDVLAKKKEMVDPLTDAEKSIKARMADYMLRKEAERKALEDAQRKLAQAEAEKRLAEAMEAESSGDVATAQMAFAEAEVYDTLSGTLTVNTPKTKADGVSVRKTYRIVSVDPSKVPVELGGVCIRPVDEKAVLGLIKASEGKIKIDGIEYVEDAIISVRAS